MNSSALPITISPPASASAPIGPRFPIQAVTANHFALIARNAANLRFGYDAEASVRFVVTHALPLWGRVLDIGTGKGRFMAALAPHVAQLTTVDVSAEQQTCAKLEATYAGVAERIEFVLGDARQLPWPVASFAAVVSMNAFHHLDNPEGTFNEMLRVLQPGGKLVLADFSTDGFEIMAAIHRAEGQSHPYPPSQFARWEARLREQGFLVRRFQGHHQEVLVATHFALLPDSSCRTNPA